MNFENRDYDLGFHVELGPMRVPLNGMRFVRDIIKQAGMKTSPFKYPNSSIDFFLRGKKRNKVTLHQDLAKEYKLKTALAEPSKWFANAMKQPAEV